jgi:hypothetical protein
MTDAADKIVKFLGGIFWTYDLKVLFYVFSKRALREMWKVFL